ncbi:MAG: hypothetical protein HKP05_12160 [Woeseiaceae bacterium]|nr:hypothetical protein [Gammaproteobacteria bacterium]NNK26393.1 hypothetical protein [Woeseiaceae bacterium]
MSNKSDTHEPRVSAIYREVATETTPAHLDRSVHEAARAGARTRYGLARAWMRPVAWAATIALSFAFVLQLTQDDDIPGTAIPENRAEPALIPAGTDGAVVEPRSAAGGDIMKAKELSESTVPQAPARSALELAPSAVDAAAAGFTDPVSCGAAARASAASWYECIEALREKGLNEAADVELEALQTAFPEFSAPNAN